MLFLQRQLDSCERSLAGLPSAFCVRYAGVLDETALARSFRLLCGRHPVLCATIGPGHILSASGEHCPELDAVDGDERDMYELATGEWDNSRAVARLLLVRGNAEGFVVLRLDHAIADGSAYLALFAELWDLYTGIVDGREIPERPGSSLPSSPSLLVWRYLGGVEPATVAAPAPAGQTGCAARYRRIKLTSADTTALITAARAANISVNAMISAAILLSLRGTGSTVMTVKSPVGLRTRVTPVVGATEATNFTGGHTATVSVGDQDEPAALGRRIKKQLDEGIARREFYIRGLLRMDLADIGPSHNGSALIVGINNHGVVPVFPQPAELDIVDFLWPGPQPRQTGTIMSADYRLHTYAGELSIACHYPSTRYSEAEVTRIVDGLVAQLVLIAGTAVAPSVTA